MPFFRSHKLVILVVATTGEGDATDNAKKFNRYHTSKATPLGSLQGLKYAIFGLGDLNYINFNQMGKRTEINMDRLGAAKIYHRGIGDASQDIEADLRKWIDGGLIEAVRENVPNLTRTGSKPVVVLTSGLPDLLEMMFLREPRPPITSPLKGEGCSTLSKVFWTLSTGQVLRKRELRQCPGDQESTVEVEVSLPADATYSPCDTIEVLPENTAEQVQRVANYFDASDLLDVDIDFVTPTGKPAVVLPFPTPCTLRTALTSYMDLNVSPSKTFLSNLAILNKDNLDVEEALYAMSSDTALMKEMHSNHFVNVLDILELFSQSFGGKIKITLAQFLQIGPKQRIRPYTGASCVRASDNSVKLVVALTATERPPIGPLIAKMVQSGILPDMATEVGLPSTGTFRGTCSSFLQQADVGKTVHLRVRESVLRPPHPAPSSVLAIVTGAGIAPFMAYVDHFNQTGWPESVLLVFGCRSRDSDWLYCEEISTLEKEGRINCYFAFSRDGDKKVYVQDIVKRSRSIHKILNQINTEKKGRILICGSTQMCRSVCETIAAQIGGQSQLELLEARAIVTVENFG